MKTTRMTKRQQTTIKLATQLAYREQMSVDVPGYRYYRASTNIKGRARVLRLLARIERDVWTISSVAERGNVILNADDQQFIATILDALDETRILHRDVMSS